MEQPGGRRFQMRYLLGRGGFGEVYRATMTTPGGLVADVAVKLLRIEGGRGDSVQRLRDEGRLLSALQHAAILRAWDLATLEGRVALVTEYVDGQDLAACFHPSDPDPMPPRAQLEAIAQVAEGLDAAWSTPQPGSDQPMRIVHRDIKPSNLRVGPHGQVKILDFGIARADHADREAQTGANATLGSLAYMAPERFGRRAPGPECDVYALGCVLFEGITGRRLHADAVPIEMVTLAADGARWSAHVEEALAGVDAPEAVRELLRAMLDHDPARRPSARELAVRCEELAPTLAGAPLKRWARERRWPEAAPMTGPLDGRALTDGTLDAAARLVPPTDPTSDTFQFDGPAPDDLPGEAPAPVPAADPPSPARSPWPWVAAAVACGLLALSAWWLGGTTVTAPRGDPPPVAISPAPAKRPAPVAPAPAPPGDAAPTPAPAAQEPAAPSPGPAEPPPAPDGPAAVVPAPEPSEAPLAAPPTAAEPPGKVSVTGATLVAVEVDGARVAADAVPSRRDLFLTVDFGQDVHRIGPYLVSPGATLRLRCVRMTQECDVE